MTSPIGTLIVVVLKAQHLDNKSFFKQDVYAKVTFNGVTKQTKVDPKGGQHPMWDEELRFPVTSEKSGMLETSCWAKEHRDDTLLGEAKVDMKDTLKTGEFDEWIPLSTNGTQRGEIYLEITYWSHGPAPAQPQQKPAKFLAPATANLARRPSKWDPKDRLSRVPVPLQNQRPPQVAPKTPPKDGRLPLPGTLKPGPAAGVPSTLKPGPAAGAPSSLQPGGPPRGSPPPPAATNSAAAVPSILRPGNPSAGARRSSSSSPKQSHFTAYSPIPNPYESSPSPSSIPNPYDTPHATPNPYVSTPTPAPQNPYTSTPTPAPAPQNQLHNQHPARQSSNPSILDWNSPSTNAPQQGPISFPVPGFGAAPGTAPSTFPPNTNGYTPGLAPAPTPMGHQRTSSFSGYPPPQPQNQFQNQPSRNGSGDLPDPYLIARYQTPLPLPPGASPSPNPSAGHRRTASAGTGAGSMPGAYPHPDPSTAYQHKPAPPLPAHPAHPSINTSINSLHPASDPVSRTRTPIDESRLQAQRQAEEAAARRREQEERDEEFARQLLAQEEEGERESRDRAERERKDKELRERESRERAEKEQRERAERERAERERKEREERERREKERKAQEAKAEREWRELKEREAEAERKRKEQEQKDEEMARMLDRELNVAGLGTQ